MDVKSKTLWGLLLPIIQQDQTRHQRGLKVMLYNKQLEKYINVIKVLDLDITEDYVNGTSEERIIKLMLPAGEWAHHVAPYKDFLQVHLAEADWASILGLSTKEQVVYHNYRAIPVQIENVIEITGNKVEYTKDKMDLSSTVEVDFQLINETYEVLRKTHVSTIYRNALPMDATIAMLTNASKEACAKAELDERFHVQGVDACKADNEEIQTHMVIPPLQLTDFPQFVQQKAGGLYSSGLGYFFKDYKWWVYPRNNLDVNSEEPRRMVNMYLVPANVLPGIERTFLQSENLLEIMITGEAKVFDNRSIREENNGTGLLMTKPEVILNDGVKVGNNQAYVNAPKLTVDAAYAKTGVENTTNRKIQPASSNVYEAYSKLSGNSGVFINVIWQNSKPALIIPGLYIELHYMVNDKLFKRKAVVHKVMHHYSLNGKGTNTMSYLVTTSLMLYTEPINGDTYTGSSNAGTTKADGSNSKPASSRSALESIRNLIK